MNKKILSLIIILFAISSLGFVFFANDLISSLFVQRDNKKVLEYAHGVDRSGNIYFIRKEKEQSFLVSVDSTGRQSYKKNISDKVAKQSIFDSIFIDQDKNLFLTVYEIMPGSSQITEVGIYMFRDDGNFVAQIFKNGIQQNYDSKFRLVSAMSDDDRNLFFGFLNGTSLDVFAYEKGKTEQVKKVNAYSIGEISDKINAFYVLPSGDAIFSLESGTLLKKSNSENRDTSFTFNGSNKVIIERFWFAGNQFYCQDAISGNMYISSSSKLEPYLVMKGNKVISEKDGITFAQLNPVAVGNVGNVAGALNKGSFNRLFLGGFAFLPEVGKTDPSDSKDLTKWFLLIGIVAGSIILSLLLWDCYCSILHMKLSMLFRQAFMVILVIFLALYTLTSFIIIPKSEDMIGNVHLAEQIQKGQMFTASCKGFVTSQQGSELDQEKAIAFFAQFRENRSRLWLTTKNEIQNEAQISLITMDAGQYVLLASDERYEEGFPAARMGYGGDFINGIREAENKTINSLEVMSKNGIERCVLMPTGMTFSGSPVILSIIVGLDVLNKEISDRTGTITVYIALVGLILVLLVMVVEYFTVHNVRRLKNSV
ncbi:MAG: hypothetical protein PHP51_06915, partial [Desulfotomaculaceae bacterium]|nr:hypothetical protein [Desulfotomaculaceae bacterium]